jgi:hypothetical protein
VSVHIPTGRERKEGLSERKENVMSRKDNNVGSGARRDSTGVQKKDSALRRRKGAAAAPTAKVEEAEPQVHQHEVMWHGRMGDRVHPYGLR